MGQAFCCIKHICTLKTNDECHTIILMGAMGLERHHPMLFGEQIVRRIVDLLMVCPAKSNMLTGQIKSMRHLAHRGSLSESVGISRQRYKDPLVAQVRW